MDQDIEMWDIETRSKVIYPKPWQTVEEYKVNVLSLPPPYRERWMRYIRTIQRLHMIKYRGSEDASEKFSDGR